jgi:hypothetical protein
MIDNSSPYLYTIIKHSLKVSYSFGGGDGRQTLAEALRRGGATAY